MKLFSALLVGAVAAGRLCRADAGTEGADHGPQLPRHAGARLLRQPERL